MTAVTQAFRLAKRNGAALTAGLALKVDLDGGNTPYTGTHQTLTLLPSVTETYNLGGESNFWDTVYGTSAQFRTNTASADTTMVTETYAPESQIVGLAVTGTEAGGYGGFQNVTIDATGTSPAYIVGATTQTGGSQMSLTAYTVAAAGDLTNPEADVANFLYVGHGLTTGDIVTVSLAAPAAYNEALVTVTRIDDDNFQYAITGSPGVNTSASARFTAVAGADTADIIASGVNPLILNARALCGGNFVFADQYSSQTCRIVCSGDTSAVSGLAASGPNLTSGATPSAIITATGRGDNASGYINNLTNDVDATIEATGDGSKASGIITSTLAGSVCRIAAIGRGAKAEGESIDGAIIASGRVSKVLALISATGGSSVTASGAASKVQAVLAANPVTGAANTANAVTATGSASDIICAITGDGTSLSCAGAGSRHGAFVSGDSNDLDCSGDGAFLLLNITGDSNTVDLTSAADGSMMTATCSASSRTHTMSGAGSAAVFSCSAAGDLTVSGDGAVAHVVIDSAADVSVAGNGSAAFGQTSDSTVAGRSIRADEDNSWQFGVGTTSAPGELHVGADPVTTGVPTDEQDTNRPGVRIADTGHVYVPDAGGIRLGEGNRAQPLATSWWDAEITWQDTIGLIIDPQSGIGSTADPGDHRVIIQGVGGQSRGDAGIDAGQVHVNAYHNGRTNLQMLSSTATSDQDAEIRFGVVTQNRNSADADAVPEMSIHYDVANDDGIFIDGDNGAARTNNIKLLRAGGMDVLIGDLTVTAGALNITAGALNHDGSTVGLYDAEPTSQATGYTTFGNLGTDRTLDADSTTIDEMADVLGTLIEDLKLTGIIAA